MENNEFNEDAKVAEFLAQFDRIKTPEEIEKEKEEYKKEILSKGFLPINDELNEFSSISLILVDNSLVDFETEFTCFSTDSTAFTTSPNNFFHQKEGNKQRILLPSTRFIYFFNSCVFILLKNQC